MNILRFFVTWLLLLGQYCSAQSVVRDESVRYQQERMVNVQWDQSKFTPKAGFLNLNPYYWLVWGLSHSSYHNIDRRPLSATGPQTQRLALIAALSATDQNYKLQSDTVKTSAFSSIINQSGLSSGTDPLWQLYYKKEFEPVINHSQGRILMGLSPAMIQEVYRSGLYAWYDNELNMLAERIGAAHTTNLDRGSRILAYHRYLLEYRALAGVWCVRTSAAVKALQMRADQQRIQYGDVPISVWTPDNDVEIAKQVLLHVQ